VAGGANMSVVAVHMVLTYAPPEWSSGMRLVAIAIGERINDKAGPTTWCSVRDIAERTGLETRTVRRYTAALIEAGVINREERPGDRLPNRTNLWTWVWKVRGQPEVGRPYTATHRPPTSGTY